MNDIHVEIIGQKSECEEKKNNSESHHLVKYNAKLVLCQLVLIIEIFFPVELLIKQRNRSNVEFN